MPVYRGPVGTHGRSKPKPPAAVPTAAKAGHTASPSRPAAAATAPVVAPPAVNPARPVEPRETYVIEPSPESYMEGRSILIQMRDAATLEPVLERGRWKLYYGRNSLGNRAVILFTTTPQRRWPLPSEKGDIKCISTEHWIRKDGSTDHTDGISIFCFASDWEAWNEDQPLMVDSLMVHRTIEIPPPPDIKPSPSPELIKMQEDEAEVQPFSIEFSILIAQGAMIEGVHCVYGWGEYSHIMQLGERKIVTVSVRREDGSGLEAYLVLEKNVGFLGSCPCVVTGDVVSPGEGKMPIPIAVVRGSLDIWKRDRVALAKQMVRPVVSSDAGTQSAYSNWHFAMKSAAAHAAAPAAIAESAVEKTIFDHSLLGGTVVWLTTWLMTECVDRSGYMFLLARPISEAADGLVKSGTELTNTGTKFESNKCPTRSVFVMPQNMDAWKQALPNFKPFFNGRFQ